MDLNNMEVRQVGQFLRKPSFVEPKKLKIVSLEERDDNFKEGKKNLILGLEDKNEDSYLLQINATNFNDLLAIFGNNFEKDWRNNLVTIQAISEGMKDVEGTQRECFKLHFKKA